MPYRAKIGEITRNEYCRIEQHYEIDWTIKDFFSQTTVDICFESPLFSITDRKWYFSIYPNGETYRNSEGWISLSLGSYEEKHDFQVSTICRFGVKKANGMVEVMKEDFNFVFSDDNYSCMEPTFLERSKLIDRKSELAPSEALTITCTMRVNESCNFTSRLMHLSADFQKLFMSKIGCDATLRVQNEEFPVHKAILGSRSSVFDAMFQVDMKEKNTGVVDIDDCHPGSFRDFLTFVYSGRFENSSGDIFELYKIAHTYCVEQLKEICLFYINRDMSLHSVVDAAILAHQFDEEGIKTKSQKFFAENVADILPTDKWKSLLRKDPTLANELLINMTKRMIIFNKRGIVT